LYVSDLFPNPELIINVDIRLYSVKVILYTVIHINSITFQTFILSPTEILELKDREQQKINK